MKWEALEFRVEELLGSWRGGATHWERALFLYLGRVACFGRLAVRSKCTTYLLIPKSSDGETRYLVLKGGLRQGTANMIAASARFKSCILCAYVHTASTGWTTLPDVSEPFGTPSLRVVCGGQIERRVYMACAQKHLTIHVAECWVNDCPLRCNEVLMLSFKGRWATSTELGRDVFPDLPRPPWQETQRLIFSSSTEERTKIVGT